MIIGIGETVYDIIFRNEQPEAAVPGGSAFNALISLGRVGVKCAMVTETGDDHIGDITCRYLKDNGVDDGYVTRRYGTKSHVSLAFLDDKSDAHYLFFKDHAALSISDNMPPVAADDIVLFGSFFAINPVVRPQVLTMLQRAYEAGAVMYYDINFRSSHIAEIPLIMDNINENMRMATVVRGSLEDFGYLYGTTDVEEIYESHIRPYCQLFICTDGSKDIQLRTPSLSMSFPTTPIDTVSTVGAGDNFNAGFAYGIMERGIRRSDLTGLSPSVWTELIARGQQFSADVCQSLFNSVSQQFAQQMRS